jgi:protein-tyrosine phosphatase
MTEGVPDGRAELHFHLLPGVDDGPRDLADALELARLARADGTRVVVATPHVRDVAIHELPARVRELRAALRRADVALEVQVGGELGPHDVAALSDRELETIAHGPPGRRWVLIEALLSGDVDPLPDACDELRARGFGVLIAHPERCAGLLGDGAGALARELELGSRLQLNASSLTGEHGEGARLGAHELAGRGVAHVVASDAHRPTRPPRLSDALRELLAARVPERAARALVERNPAALLAGGVRPAGRAPSDAR